MAPKFDPQGAANFTFATTGKKVCPKGLTRCNRRCYSILGMVAPWPQNLCYRGFDECALVYAASGMAGGCSTEHQKPMLPRLQLHLQLLLLKCPSSSYSCCLICSWCAMRSCTYSCCWDNPPHLATENRKHAFSLLRTLRLRFPPVGVLVQELLLSGTDRKCEFRTILWWPSTRERSE